MDKNVVILCEKKSQEEKVVAPSTSAYHNEWTWHCTVTVNVPKKKKRKSQRERD